MKKRARYDRIVRMAPSVKETDYSKNELLIIGIIFASAVLPFLTSLKGEFVFDDSRTIVDNDVVQGKVPLYQVLLTDYWGEPMKSPSSHKSYRPLTTLTFWLDKKVQDAIGFTLPVNFHAVNILLHATNALLVYQLMKELLAAFFNHGVSAITAAILFAVHPVHTEAVANLSGRAELLMALFFCAGSIFFIKRRQEIGVEARNTATFTVICLAALAAKEQGALLPVMCILIDWLLPFPQPSSSEETSRARKRKRKRRDRTFLLGVIFVSLCVTRYWMNSFKSPRFSPLDNPSAHAPTALLKLLSYSYLHYRNLLLLLWPSSLCFDYSMGCIPAIRALNDPRSMAAVLLVFLMTSLICFLAVVDDRRKRLVSILLCLSVIPFLPSSHLFLSVGFSLAERVLYVPSVGVCGLIGLLFQQILLRQREIAKTAAPILFYLAVAKSFQRSSEWQNGLSLYSADVSVCPTNAKIYYNLGRVLADAGRPQEAEEKYRYALRSEVTAHLLAAEGLLREAIRIQPALAVAWMNLGIVAMRAGIYNESERHLRHSLSLRPKSADCWFNLGNVLQKRGDLEGAKGAWLNAIDHDPRHTRSWTNLFVLLDEMDRCEEALSLSRECAAEVTSLPSTRATLGACLARRGDFSAAEQQLLAATYLQPKAAIYHANLGVLYHRWKKYDDALDSYSTALSLDPTLHSIRNSFDVIKRRKSNSTRTYPAKNTHD